MFLVLERALKVNNPWVFGFDQDLSLSLDVTNLVFIEHLRLLHFLHGNNLSGFSKFAYTDFAKSSSTNYAQWLEILQSNLLPPTQCYSKIVRYIFLLSSASLCSISCLISSCSDSLRLSFSIFLTSISHATTMLQVVLLPSFLSFSSSLSF